MKTPRPPASLSYLYACMQARYLCSRNALGQHIFGLFLAQNRFLQFYSTTVNNTSREVYLRSLTYRTENAPEALYYSVEYAVLLVIIIYNLMFVVITINSMLGLC